MDELRNEIFKKCFKKEIEISTKKSPNSEADGTYGSMSMKVDSNSRTRLVGENTSWWASRTSLEKKLVVGSVILTLFVIGLIIALAVVSNSENKSADPTPTPANTSTTVEPPTVEVCVTPECTKAAAILLESLDTSVDPCDDFYKFACGNWGQVHPIPDDEGKFGTFGLIDQRILNDYRTILEKIDDSKPDFYLKMKTLYTACMDEETIGNVSLSVVQGIFDSLGGWPIINTTWTNTSFDPIQSEAYSRRIGGFFEDTSNALVTIYVSFDSKNTTINRIQFDQPYLFLGREHLLHPEKFHEEIAAYKTLITNVAKYMAKEFGDVTAFKQKDVDDIVAFEANLAKITTAPEDRRDKERLYNKMTLTEMTSNVSKALDWLRLLNLTFQNVEVEINENETVIVWEKEYFRKLESLLNETDIRVVANYAMWRQVAYLLKHLGKDIENLEFEFEEVISGTKEIEKRWKQCVKYVDEAIGMVLGREFVHLFFGSDGKAKAKELIADVRSSFIHMLSEVDWMNEDIKAKATEKAIKMIENIGFPDWIFNDTAQEQYYSLVVANNNTHLKNLLSAVEASRFRELNELRDVPAKKTEWYMTPGTVNAYFESEGNSINFPAGILQSPFFYIQHPMMMNFGEIGSIIGHEITHGFDDEGRQYDKDGNLNEWWPEEVVKKFQNKTRCFVNMYQSYCPSEFNGTLCLNGENTLGENIADNGGVKASFRAYQNWVKAKGKELPLPGLANYTPEQIFFLSFANSWCTVIRKEALQSQILYDVHSPGRYRVLGTLSNSEDFSKAFGCPQKSKMNREHRCVLW